MSQGEIKVVTVKGNGRFAISIMLLVTAIISSALLTWLNDWGSTTPVSASVNSVSQVALTENAAWDGFAGENANFGISTSRAGDLNGDGFDDVIVGADLYDGNGVDSGAVFVFYGSPGGLSGVPSILLLGENAGDMFGGYVSEAGDVNGDGFDDILVGASQANAGKGAVYAFYGSASGLNFVPDWVVYGTETAVGFGMSLASAGDVNGDGYDDILIGSPFANPKGDTLPPGHVYAYYGSVDGLSTVPDWEVATDPIADGLVEAPEFGYSVGSAGDVNNDSYADIIIGSPRYTTDGATGAAFVFLGSPSGLPAPIGGGSVALASTTNVNADNSWFGIGASVANAYFGEAVSSAGDVNGDSFDDVLVGAPLDVDGQSNPAGKVYLYLGSASGPSAVADVALAPSQVNALFGVSVNSVGDINLDGLDDVIVGAPDFDGPAVRPLASEAISQTGAAFVYLGDATNLLSQPQMWLLSEGIVSVDFGFSVDGAGDVNNDGHPDMIVGDPGVLASNGTIGGAFGYYGSGPISGLVANNDSPTGLGNSTRFDAQIGSGGLADFSWDFGDGITAVGNPVSHVYAAPGQYTATVTATNEFSQVTAVTLATITVQDLVLPGQGGSVNWTDPQGRGVGADIPAGAVDSPLLLQFNPLDSITERPPDPGTEGIPVGYYFDLDVASPEQLYLPLLVSSGGGSGQAVVNEALPQTAVTAETAASFTFNKPITITVSYNEQQVLAAGLTETSLILSYWDAAANNGAGGWIDAATTCTPASTYAYDPANDQYQLQICHFSRFGLIGAN
jgi:PKD repeat protein